MIMLTESTLTAALAIAFPPSSSLIAALSVAGWATGLVFIAACVGLWVMSCRAYPYNACPKCDALGRVKDPSGKHWRTCPRCAGEGQQLRPGARLFGSSRGTRGTRRGHDR